MNHEGNSEPLNKTDIQPVVTETLRCLGRRTGCATALTVIFRNQMPAEKARLDLIKHGDWGPAIAEIHRERSEQLTSMKRHLAQLPTEYASSRAYQDELRGSLGPQVIRFYEALWQVMMTVVGNEEIGRTLEKMEPMAGESFSFEETALFVANFPSVARFLEIPDNPFDQLALVKNLGPGIFRGWHNGGPSEQTRLDSLEF